VFEIVGAIVNVEIIATGSGIRELRRLRRTYGKGQWRKKKGLLEFGSAMAASTPRKSTGTRRTASVAKKRSSSASSAKRRANYVVCLSNRGFAASLERRKLYRVLPDAPASKHGLLRVIDETGASYLYPASRFQRLALTARVVRALSR
jgi:hypothetical protein